MLDWEDLGGKEGLGVGRKIGVEEGGKVKE